METARQGVSQCDQDNAEMVAAKQQIVDELQQKIDAQKATIEATAEDQKAIAKSLEEEDQKIAGQDAEKERLAREEKHLARAKAELMKSEEKEEEDDGDDDEKEINFDDLISEMVETPDKDLEVEFPKGDKGLVIYAKINDKGEIDLEHRFIGPEGRIEDVISNYGIGTEGENDTATVVARGSDTIDSFEI